MAEEGLRPEGGKLLHLEVVVSGLRLGPRRGDLDAAVSWVHLAAPGPPQVSSGAQGQAAWAGGPALTPSPEAGSSGRLGAEQAGRAGRAGKPPAGARLSPAVGGPSKATRAMELRLGGYTAAAAAVLLLVLPGAQGQHSTPSPKCDCAYNFQKRNGLFCCKGCPAGHYLKAPCPKPCGTATCLPCPRGTFLARENHHETRCTRCQACDEEVSQVALTNCSTVADTHCGCEPGWFPECLVKSCKIGSPFRCHPCSDCRALHRHTRVPCSARDTDCGNCLPGFYEYGNSCVPCPTSTLRSCPEPCVTICGWRQMFWVQVVLAGLVVPLLLGAVLTYTYHRCQTCKPKVANEAGTEALTPRQATHLSPKDSTHTLLAPLSNSEKVHTVQLVGSGWTPGSPQTQEVPCPEVAWSWDRRHSRALGPPPPLSPAPPAGSAAATLQPGPQLYDVMDAVPARRWKEFVRTLGLREAEIEAVEVEVGRFRDQQYEMLKRWRQQQPAGLGAVYAALERMGLDGCAEDLRSRLQRGP
ncbi:tumor necrosis factor receptor superfamily member 25 isoform X2 [Leptonychotes weddellii]|uniref:Tumor necrosis factor receptor superfamily member 25 isoform X2 n=1 Tax=Leptonychotes weddellii TaxID=9713 RepID=A0A2U3YZY0_LEPWE|nr:tumor necrosis factor receptor superfamily member 25 isoform X2 [Leptonychotes weddellii]